MIGQMKVLLRVKELKQDQAFRAMQLKRQQAEAARAAKERADGVVEESRRTYASREDAIFDGIIGQIVDLGMLDETHGRVVQLEKSHVALKDQLERAIHVERRVEGELEQSRNLYRDATKVRDKYVVLTDEMRIAAEREADEREEAEIEDMFSRPAKQPS